MTHYEIGDTVPIEGKRGIVHGPTIPPVWHPLIVHAQRMRSTRERLRAQNIFAFYPSEEYTRHVRGKAITKERAFVTGWVYAQFRQPPQFDVMKERGIILGVFCIESVPIIIPSDIIKHLQGLTVEAERLRQARAELLKLKVGDKAKVLDGPLAGSCINITDIRGGEAWYDALAGFKGSARLERLEKIIT